MLNLNEARDLARDFYGVCRHNGLFARARNIYGENSLIDERKREVADKSVQEEEKGKGGRRGKTMREREGERDRNRWIEGREKKGGERWR